MEEIKRREEECTDKRNRKEIKRKKVQCGRGLGFEFQELK